MLNRLKNLRTNENVLLAVDTLLHSKATFTNTFLLAFMIRTSLDNSPAEFITYKLLCYVGMAALAILLLHFVKKHTLTAWRLGMLFSIVQIIVIITLHTETTIFPYVLALVTAVESTLYWRPNMFFTISEVRNDRRLRFHSIRQILTESIKIVMPLVLGLTITESGYIQSAFIILIISVVQLLLSVLFRPSHTLNLPTHHPDVTYRKIINNQSLRRVLYLQFFRGIVVSGSAFLLIPPILVYQQTGSDLDLGFYASIGALVSIVIILFFQQISHHKRFARVFLWILAPLAVVFSAALTIFPSHITAIALYIYSVAVIESFFNMFVLGKVQRSLKKQLGGNSFTLEIESISEVFMCVGRVVSLSALLFVVNTSGATFLPLFATLSAVLIVPVVIFSHSKKKAPIEGEIIP